MFHFRKSPWSLALLVICACQDETGGSRQSSSSTNWLRCEDTADCSDYPNASCSTDGYCVDANGQRIVADGTPDGDDSEPTVNPTAEDDSDPSNVADDDVADDSAPDDDSTSDDVVPTDDDSTADDSLPSDDDAPSADDAPPDDVTTDDDSTTPDDDVATTDDDATSPDDDATDASTPGDDDTNTDPETSAGTVTIQLTVEPERYCNPGPYCDGARGHISIVRIDDGTTLRPANAPFCGYTPCETCEAPACIGAGCLPTPREVNDEQVSWDGSYQEEGSCGDANAACHNLRYVPPGRYLARMCATPGSIVTAPADETGIETTCEPSGPDECVEVEFDYPSADPVEGRLPIASEDPAEDAGTPSGSECVRDSDCSLGGLTCCDGRCVNLYNDPFNCGECGNECGAEQPYCAGSCQQPACQETCTGEQICCLQMVGPWAPLCSDLEGGTCPVGCPECVCNAPDTLIATPNGERRIDQLELGDLVYSVDRDGIVVVPVLRVQKTPVWHHQVVEVRLESGAVLHVSPRHPTADGRTFADLNRGGELDGVAIEAVSTVPYVHPFTHDILPGSSTGTYFAHGVAIGSTLQRHR